MPKTATYPTTSKIDIRRARNAGGQSARRGYPLNNTRYLAKNINPALYDAYKNAYLRTDKFLNERGITIPKRQKAYALEVKALKEKRALQKNQHPKRKRKNEQKTIEEKPSKAQRTTQSSPTSATSSRPVPALVPAPFCPLYSQKQKEEAFIKWAVRKDGVFKTQEKPAFGFSKDINPLFHYLIPVY